MINHIYYNYYFVSNKIIGRIEMSAEFIQMIWIVWIFKA